METFPAFEKRRPLLNTVEWMESLWVPRRTVTYFYTWERKRFRKLYIVHTVHCLWSDHTIFSPTGEQYCVQIFCITISCWVTRYCADPSGCGVLGLGLRPSACWDRGFQSHRGHGCLSLVQCLCCQVEVSATGRSLVQRSPNDCGVRVWASENKNPVHLLWTSREKREVNKILYYRISGNNRLYFVRLNMVHFVKVTQWRWI
jgi:WD40 repeat protein